MDLQTIINIVAGLVLSVMGWFARQLWEAVKKLQEDLHRLEVILPQNYTSKSDFDTVAKEIRDGFQRIYDKLDGKADK